MNRTFLIRTAAGLGVAVGCIAWTETPAVAETMIVAQPPRTTPDARSLLGRPVRNMQGEIIGEVTSVHLGPDGEVMNVIVGIGQTLGLGPYDVALPWNGLAEAGTAVTVNASRQALSALPQYRYPNPAFRGTVFRHPQPVIEP